MTGSADLFCLRPRSSGSCSHGQSGPNRSCHAVSQRDRDHLDGLADKHPVAPVRCLTVRPDVLAARSSGPWRRARAACAPTGCMPLRTGQASLYRHRNGLVVSGQAGPRRRMRCAKRPPQGGCKGTGRERAASGRCCQSAGQGVFALPLADPRGDLLDPGLCVAQLAGQSVQRRAGPSVSVAGSIEKAIDVMEALRHVVRHARLRCDDPELSQMRPDRVCDLRPLSNQEVPCLVIERPACRSADFTGTKHIVGRVTASHIACTSTASVLPR